jgi:predicted nuclease with RNAse H fold
VHRTKFESFIGIDLGGGKGKKTALALIKAVDGHAVVSAMEPRSGRPPLYDAALIDAVLATGESTLVCIDAPLTLPACLRCEVPVCPGQGNCIDPAVVQMNRLANESAESNRDSRRGKPPVTPYTQRGTEVYLHRRRGILPRETLGQGMGPLTARASHLLRALASRFRLNENLIEVYPRATLELLGFDEPYKKRVDARLQILAGLPDLTFGPGAWREQCVQSDHFFDSVICAYTGFLWSRDAWQLPADIDMDSLLRDGWIWVPPEAPGAAHDKPAGNPKQVVALGPTASPDLVDGKQEDESRVEGQPRRRSLP